MKQKVIKRIEEKTSVIGVVGLGYVGLPLALAFADKGFKVIGLDICEEKVAKINEEKKSYIKHIESEKIEKLVQQGRLEATADFKRVGEMDALLLCLPTPLNAYREPDLSFVLNTMDRLLPHLKEGQLLSLESTTYPGTTEEELATRVERLGFTIGKDYFVIYSPEREDPGNPEYTTHTIPKVVGGITPDCLEVGVELYGSIIEKVIPVSSTKAAELTKLLENIYRAVNIGLVNEMKTITDKMGVDIWEVIAAAATKPFGYTPFYPGPGLGGHCIPIDPFYLTWKARELNVNTRFIELAGEINALMPEWVVQKVISGLNEREKALKNARILILGIAYKKNIDDTRESPSIKLMELIKKKGGIVLYSDPYQEVFPKMRDHSFDLKSVELSPELLRSIDCVIIATDHDDFDYEKIQRYSDLIIDTRGVYKKNYENVWKA